MSNFLNFNFSQLAMNFHCNTQKHCDFIALFHELSDHPLYFYDIVLCDHSSLASILLKKRAGYNTSIGFLLSNVYLCLQDSCFPMCVFVCIVLISLHRGAMGWSL